MNSAIRALVFASCLLAPAALDFAGSTGSSYVGSWFGDYAVVQHTVAFDGSVNDLEGTTPSATLDCDPSHVATWQSDLVGLWSQANGKYRVKLSKSYAFYVEGAIPPDATVHGAHYDLTNVEVAGATQFANLKYGEKIKEGGLTMKVKAAGGCVALRQP